MTVPVVGVIRKSGWRYLPEIHATRLSVSGSLRPKLGLLILLVLLVLGVVLLVVPLATRLQATHTTSHSQPQAIHLSQAWTGRLLSAQLLLDNAVCSPAGLVTGLNALALGAVASTKALLQLTTESLTSAFAAPTTTNNTGLLFLNKLFIQNGPQISREVAGEATRLGLSIEQVEINDPSARFEEKVGAWLQAVSSGHLAAVEDDSLAGLHRPAQLVLVGAYRVAARLSGFTRMVDQSVGFQSANMDKDKAMPAIFVTRVGAVGVASFADGTVKGVKLSLAGMPQHALLCVQQLRADQFESDYLNVARYQRTLASVQLPLWRIDRTVDLLSAVPASQADYSGLAAVVGGGAAASLKLTDVKQRIVFELLEDGSSTETKELEQPAEDILQIVFDCPFFYALVHRQTGEVVIAGILRNPAQ